MKRLINMFYIGLSLFMAISFAACSDDDNDVTPSATFELVSMGAYDLADLDKQDFVVSEIKFATNSNWRVSSDKIWVLFSTTEDGEYFNDLSGASGEHSIFMKITNDARTFEPAGAEVTFSYGSEKYLLGTIYRHAKTPSLDVTDENGVSIKEIVIEDAASTVIKLNSNIPFGVKYYPEWVKEPEYENGCYTIAIANEYVPYTLSGNIVLASVDGNIEYTYPIVYAGISPTYMLIEGEYKAEGWEIALDGKVFRNKTNSIEETAEDIILENCVSYKIKCLNYNCAFVFVVENSNGSILLPAASWLRAEQSTTDPSVVSVYADPFVITNEEVRKGCLFAMPAGMKDAFVEAAKAAAQYSDFKEEYNEYLLIEASQKDLYAYNGFVVTDSKGNTFNCLEETNEDLYNWASSEMGTTEVYCMTAENGVKYTINTLITKVEGRRAFGLYDAKGVVSSRSWGSPVLTVNAEGYYEITLTAPAKQSSFENPVVLCIKDENTINLKALIIKPVNN